jgi:LacI family transcriptional regulator/LacI family xylobiose transport system transcriptional regulator
MPGGDRSAPARTPPGRRPTIAQIAAQAGVSVATVSKVINGRADVGPQTRKRVEQLIHRHGYRRGQRAAGPLALLELVFRQMLDTYAIDIINGVQQVAREHRLTLAISELQGHTTPQRGWIEDVLARRPTGVIAVFSGLTETQADQLHSRGIPLVLIDPSGEPTHTTPSVTASNWNGGLTATRHLPHLGHRRIAIITGPAHALASRARLDGYTTAMDTAQVPVDPALIRSGEFHTEHGLLHARDLLALPDPPTAIFACNDSQALGVYHAAAHAGLRIPHDLSVVGFDDLPPAQWTIPALTTIRQPLAEMATTAATMALTLAQGKPLIHNNVTLATELVVRDSTAPCHRQP